METQVTPQIVETQQQIDEEIPAIAQSQQIVETQSQQVNEEIPAIAKSQARVTKNPRKIAAGRKGALARKAKLMHNSNIEHSRLIKTWVPGVVAIAVVWLFYKTGEEKTSPPITQQQVQLEVSPHIML